MYVQLPELILFLSFTCGEYVSVDANVFVRTLPRVTFMHMCMFVVYLYEVLLCIRKKKKTLGDDYQHTS